MLNRESDVPMYMQIQEQLEEMLLEGALKANDIVPSEHELAEKLKVSRLTVRKGYAEMVKRGLFYTIQGKGTFVKEDYQPAVAPGNQIRRKKVIGVILPEVQDFFGDVFAAVKRESEKLGYSTALMFNDEIKNEITAIRQMLASDVVGIIIAPSRSANTIVEHYQKLMSAETPVVMIGRPPFKINASCVCCDDVFAAYRSVELLVEHENKGIAYVTGKLYTDESEQERYQGYTLALRDYLPDLAPVVLDAHSEQFSVSVAKALGAKIPVTAFFCYCDAAAAAVYSEVEKCGKKIPQDIEIIGYDNVQETYHYGLPQMISTVDQRRDLMGAQAVRLLKERVETAQEKHTHIQVVVHPKLVLKDTTR